MITLLVILLLVGSVALQPTGTDVEVLPVTLFYYMELGLSEPSTILDVILPKLNNLASSMREACVSAERTPNVEYGNVAVNYTTRGQLTVDFEFAVAGDENGDCSKLIFSLTGSCSSGRAELYEPLSWFRVNQNGYVLQKCYPTMWGSWTDWSSCSGSCGVGKRSRFRHCFQTSSGNGCIESRPCLGDVIETEQCTHNTPCGACSSVWANWGEWSPCSGACGKGCRSRSRGCSGIAILGESASCLGDIIAVDNCSHPEECSQCDDLVI